MRPPEETFEGEIEVGVMGPVSHADLVPLLDDLNGRYLVVRSTRWNMTPPMAGELDVLIWLAIGAGGAMSIGAVEYVRKFAGLMAEDHYKSVRSWLRKLRDKGQQLNPERLWQIAIYVGSHRFYIRGPLDDDQFVARLQAAQSILDESPAFLIERSDAGPPEMEPGWYWRDDEQRWVPTPGLAEAMRRGESRGCTGK